MKIDMSEKAITARLKIVNELRKICLSLAKANPGKKIREPMADNKQKDKI